MNNNNNNNNNNNDMQVKRKRGRPSRASSIKIVEPLATTSSNISEFSSASRLNLNSVEVSSNTTQPEQEQSSALTSNEVQPLDLKAQRMVFETSTPLRLSQLADETSTYENLKRIREQKNAREMEEYKIAMQLFIEECLKQGKTKMRFDFG
jgi:hypothetical protein